MSARQSHPAFDYVGSHNVAGSDIYTFRHKKNGLMVTFAQNESPNVACYGVVHMGSADEARWGSAHLLEHEWFRKGGISQEVNGPFKVLQGCSVNAMTTQNFTCMTLQGAPSYAAKMIDQTSERLFDYNIDPDALEVEKMAVLNEAQNDHGPFEVCLQHLTKVAMSNGYDHEAIGTIDAVLNTSANDLIEMKRHFSVPNNVHLILAGNVDATMLDDVEKSFGSVPRSQHEIERVGLKPCEPQFDTHYSSTVVPGSCPVVAVGFRSPMRGNYEVADDDVALKLLSHAFAETPVQQHFESKGFMNVSVFNPGSASPGLFTVLGASTGPNPSSFLTVVQESLDVIRGLPAKKFRGYAQNIMDDMKTKMGTAHGATDLLSKHIACATWKAPAALYRRMATITKADVERAMNTHLVPQGATVVVGAPESMVKANTSSKLVAMPKMACRAMPPKMEAVSPQVVRDFDGRSVVVHALNNDVAHVTISVPFDRSGGNESVHMVLKNMFDRRDEPAKYAAWHLKRRFDVSHENFTIEMSVPLDSPAQYVKAVMDEFAAFPEGDVRSIANNTASQINGATSNPVEMAKVELVNHIFSKSVYTDVGTKAQSAANTTLSALRDAHARLQDNIKFARATITSNWAHEDDADRLLGIVQSHIGHNTPTNYIHIPTGKSTRIVQYHGDGDVCTVNMDGRDTLMDARMLRVEDMADSPRRAKWVPSTNSAGLKYLHKPSLASATIMYGMSAHAKDEQAVRAAVSFLGDSMNGKLMEDVRWKSGLKCYGINGTVLKCPDDHMIVAFIGTVGDEAREEARQHMDAVLAKYAEHGITQDDLDETLHRMAGERAVAADFADRIHGQAHSDILLGAIPVMKDVSATLEEVNGALATMTNMHKVIVSSQVGRSARPTTLARAVGGTQLLI